MNQHVVKLTAAPVSRTAQALTGDDVPLPRGVRAGTRQTLTADSAASEVRENSTEHV